jgi:hypothetical protein
MSITTTQYGREIILTALGYAKGWREQHCVEDNTSCFQYLFDNDYSKVIGNPWCAFFGTRTINDAADRLGLQCPLPFQGSSKAVVDKAKQVGIRVDRKPSIGSLFWYPTDTGGHLGVIVWMDSSGLFTVEGNTGDNLKCLGCPKNAVAILGSNSSRTYQAMISKNAVFVHIEELGNTPQILINDIFTMPVSSGQQKERVLNAGMSAGQILIMLSLLGGGIYAASQS